MLPGIRFIFVTIILSVSVLIFGLGAAALLRTAHEEFASLPAWRAAPPQLPPAPAETNMPTLAMLRIETPDVTRAAVTSESLNPTPAPTSDLELNEQAGPGKSNVTGETPPQADALPATAEKKANVGGQLDPPPAVSPALSAITTALTPAVESPENAATDETDSGSKNSEAAESETQADQSEAAEAKPDRAEEADIKVAEIRAPEPNVAIAKTVEAKGREIKLQTVKVHAAKPSKPVARKTTRSGIYAVAQRRRAAARARAIARARAALIAQQRLAAMDPLAALFGIPAQPAQVVQTQILHP